MPHQGATLGISSQSAPVPPPRPSPSVAPLSPVEAQTARVVNFTALEANAGLPARLTNLTHSNIVANTNRGAQTAVANQQAHAALRLAITGKAANKIQNLAPGSTRAAVDVLTSNEVATTLMSLKGALNAFSGKRAIDPTDAGLMRHLVEKFRAQLQRIEEIDERVRGDGTAQNPFLPSGHRLYAEAGTAFLFVGKTKDELKFEVLNRLFG